MNIGVRCHDIGTFTPDILAKKVKKTGAQCVQLALSKAIAGRPSGPEDVDPHMIYDCFSKEGISIAVLGCYINPVHPDKNIRESMIKKFKNHISSAPVFRCNIVGTETGSCNPDCSYHPDTSKEATFFELVSSIAELVKHAEATGEVIVGIEPVAGKHTISDPIKMRRLLEEINSPNLGVIFDPANLVPPSGITNQKEFIDSCMENFGSKIVALHAKDYMMIDIDGVATKSSYIPAGTGLLDWKYILSCLKAINKQDVPLLIEDLPSSKIAETIQRIKSLCLSK